MKKMRRWASLRIFTSFVAGNVPFLASHWENQARRAVVDTVVRPGRSTAVLRERLAETLPAQLVAAAAAPTVDALGGPAVWEQPLRDALAAIDSRNSGSAQGAATTVTATRVAPAAAPQPIEATTPNGSGSATPSPAEAEGRVSSEVATDAAQQWSAASLKGASYAPNKRHATNADNHGAEAAVLIAVTDEPNPRVLLTRRSRALRKHAGEVSFPGGKREPCDPPGVYGDVVVALREALEEVHLHPDNVRVIGTLPLGTAKSGAVVRPIVGLVPPALADGLIDGTTSTIDTTTDTTTNTNTPTHVATFSPVSKPRSAALPPHLAADGPNFAAGLVPQPSEIDRIFWVRLEDLVSQEPVPYAIVWHGKTLHTPSFRLEGEIIWGLTGRMVSDLLRCGLGVDPHYWPIVMALRQGGTMTPEQKQLEEQTQSAIRAAADRPAAPRDFASSTR